MVEPQPEARAVIGRVLVEALFSVTVVADGHDALKESERARPDTILLALDLPDMDGLDALQQLRSCTDGPIIVVTRRGGEADRIAGLDAGADDYVVKPYAPGELLARIRAHLRTRSRRPPPCRLEFPGLVIDPARREVLVDGRPIELRRHEFDLFAFLAASPGQIFSRGQLLDHVWGSGPGEQGEATVTEHIRRIRLAIGDDPHNPMRIRTVHGVGYRFASPRTDDHQK